MTHAYTEDELVGHTAVGLFTQLGWQTVCATDETFRPDGTFAVTQRVMWCC